MAQLSPLTHALNEPAQHLVTFRRMHTIGKMAGMVVNIHARVRCAMANQIEERVPLADLVDGDNLKQLRQFVEV